MRTSLAASWEWTMAASDRTEKKLLWRKALRDHLHAHVIPVATHHDRHLSPQALQDAVLAAFTSTVGNTLAPRAQVAASSGSANSPSSLPLDSCIESVKCLKEAKKSFMAVLQHPHRAKNAGELEERSIALIAVLTTTATTTTMGTSSTRHTGLIVKDSTGEMPCEAVPPVQCVNCAVVLKKWNLICCSSYGNYLEIESMVYMDQGPPWPVSREPSSHTYLTVAAIIENGEAKAMKRVSVIGKLCAISEPLRNGPDFMIIVRIADLAATSVYRHIIIQSPELMYLPRAVKLYATYAFTDLKFVIMNKGKEDEATVLTATSFSSVERVPTEEAVASLLSTTTTTTSRDGDSRGLSDSVSPLRKRRRKGDEEDCKDRFSVPAAANGSGVTATLHKQTDLLSYKGVITRCVLPEAGVYEIDGRLILYLTHCHLCNQGRGLREGAEVEIINAHFLKMSTQVYKKMSGLVCCTLSRIEVVHFSTKDTAFKAFIPQNKLADLLSRFRAMDVAWLALVFLSLLKKFKKKREAFGVLVELCGMVELEKMKHNYPHTSFLREPHDCPFLDPVDLSHRPLVPSVKFLEESSRERASSGLFCWKGTKEGVGGSTAAAAAAPMLSVAVSATWSFGIVRSSEFPNPQVLIGTLRGNRVSGHLELTDSTGSIPLLVCVPHSSPGPDTAIPWLMSVRDGSRVALEEFTVFVEKTEEMEGTGKGELSFYIHTRDVKIMEDEKSVSGQGCSVSDDAAMPCSVLYVYIKSKNSLKLQSSASSASECRFDAQALAHRSLEELQSALSTSDTRGTADSCPVTVVVLGFLSARRYSHIHSHCTYRLSCPRTEGSLSLSKREREPYYVRVSDAVRVEMVALPVPHEQLRTQSPNDCIVEVGELVSKFYLPRLQSSTTSSIDPLPKSEKDCLVSFRGVVMEHSYRIDCDTSHLTPWQSTASLQRKSSSLSQVGMRRIVALSVRGVKCPNRVMIYCKYRPHEPLPLGLLPGAMAHFHNFMLKSSARSGNVYCSNCTSSSVAVETISGVYLTMEKETSQSVSSFRPTLEMLALPMSQLYHLTLGLLQGCLSQEVVRVRATVMTVQHASVRFHCQTCQCTMVDGSCRPTCPAKKATLNAEARILIQDGTGEAHLYVKDRVLPVALGATQEEWSDLLDLVHRVGQVTYTKSSTFKKETVARAVTFQEKAEKLFLNILTRPSLVRTLTIFCQPFISSSELKIPLGCKSHRVWVKSGTEYVTLSLPRLQLRVLAIAQSQPLSHANKLLSLLDNS